MRRMLLLELKKLSKPILAAMAVLTAVTCVLCCTLFRDYTLRYVLDKWEIGTEFIGLLFPLFVTIPICWQLYYERRDRFIVYTLPRVSKRRYLTVKWLACALSAFALLFVPYVLSGLSALYLAPYSELNPGISSEYSHVFQSLYTAYPLVYMFLLSLWKGLLGVLTMTFGFVLAMYSSNLFVVLTAPFVYLILENFTLSVLRLEKYRFVTAFEPSTIINTNLTAGSFLVGPLLMCVVIGLTALYFKKLRGRTVYPL